jgi:hypothetical protein
MIKLLSFIMLSALFLPTPSIQANDDSNPKFSIISTQKIWDKAQHAAFTDLLYHEGNWYCVFRESDQHAAGKDGIIRILQSKDGVQWTPLSLISKKGIDLRDPKLSLTPEGEFLLIIGGSEYSDTGQWLTSKSYASFSSNGKTWSDPVQILEDKEWLWRITWHDKIGYGIAYRSVPGQGRTATLYSTEDGLHYQPIQALDITHIPSEASIQFLDDGTMVALVRRGGNAWIGTSPPPYEDWSFTETTLYLGGPNFVILPDGSMLASGRVYNEDLSEKTAVCHMSETGLIRLFDLPSGGDDCSYPGMVLHQGEIWISYYSSHENQKASIYLAKIAVTNNQHD